jgi:2-dehydro-3-deoxygluconokinase
MKSIQYKPVVTFGEIMMRLSPPGFLRLTQATNLDIVFGGSEANVSVALSAFGINTLHVTSFPENDLGHAATQWLMKHGVSVSNVSYGNGRMGIYFVEHGAMHRSSRVVYDRADSVFSNIKPGTIDWDSIMKDASWFHWSGITPAISSGTAEACREALTAAKKFNVPASGDINYRRNLWQFGKKPTEAMPELIKFTQYLVAGMEDMQNCAGISSNSFEEGCRKMYQAFPEIKAIASTTRDTVSANTNNISALLFDRHKMLTSKTYNLSQIVDRIGAGDAFMAGLIYGWLSSKDDQQTLEFAVASSAWKHSVEGDTNIASVAEIENLVAGENVGKLLR